MTEPGLQAVAASALPVKDRETTETIYIDGIHGMVVFETTVILNLTRTTPTAPGSGLDPMFVDTVARLAVPLAAFARIADYMKNNLDELVRQGVITIPKQGEDGK